MEELVCCDGCVAMKKIMITYEERLNACEEKLKLLTDGNAKQEETKKVKTHAKFENNTPPILDDKKTYKNPDVSPVTLELLQKMFIEHGENMQYELFKYVYFIIPTNSAIIMSHKVATIPRFLEVYDGGKYEKIKTHDVLLHVNKILCELINTHLTKGAAFMNMNLSEKTTIGEIVCKRFAAKLNNDEIKKYVDVMH